MNPDLNALLTNSRRIVFVCSGNMVRSAFAELYARHIGLPRELASVATTYRNEALYPETHRALLERGLLEEPLQAFRPTHMDDVPYLFEEGTILFAMTHGHLRSLASSRAGDCPAFLLPEVLGGSDEIADPVLEGASFHKTFLRVERCVEALAHELQS